MHSILREHGLSYVNLDIYKDFQKLIEDIYTIMNNDITFWDNLVADADSSDFDF